MWSADLGVFLQPDEYVFLSHGGTLWSWPGQNPFRWRDPSGRYAGPWWYALGDSPAGAVVAAGASGFALGQIIAPFTIEPLVDLLNNNKNDVEKDLAKFAQSNKENPSKPRSCPTDNSGGGAKGPPPAAGDVGADAPDPNGVPGSDQQFGKKFGEHMDPNLEGYRTPEEYRQLADRIFNDPSSTVTQYGPDAAQYPSELHYELDGNLLRLDPSGNFRSLYPLGP